MTVTERDFLGSHGMPASRYPELLRMVTSGRLDPGAVVSDTIELVDVSDTLAAMTDYDTTGVPVVTEFE
jgi:alcohol dehydrogenase